MRLNTSDFIQRTIFISGTWDEHVARIIKTHVRPGDLFVDVGANVGFYALLAAAQGARVIAFEPNPKCSAAMVENAGFNGFEIDVRTVGLAGRRDTAKLYVQSPGNLGSATLRRTGDEIGTIRLDTLDAQLEGLMPTLIKIDVEGAEIGVVEGASRTLSASNGPTVLMEISEYSLLKAGGSKDRLFELMGAFGYHAEIVSPVRRSLATDEAIYFQYDALFTKKAGS